MQIKTMKKTEHPTTVAQLQNVKHLCNWTIRGRKKRENKTKVSQVIVPDNFPKLRTDTKLQMQETQRSPNRVNPKQQTKTKTKTNKQK